MPFGLKNAGATYQRMMQNYLSKQIGRNVQVYVDDIVIKTKQEDTLLDDLRETFANLNRYNIKLNPKKCVFGVPAEQLVGYLVSARGIEVDPEKIQAILTMEQPTKLREVQRLAGRVAALSRFISKLGEKALPFYQLMKKSDSFEWTPEAQAAFVDLKRTLTTPPILVAPRKREPLFLYVAATNRVVSTVLVVERMEELHNHSIQRPVYYLSEVLSISKQRYPHYQKLTYAVFMTSRKVVHYFVEHPITIVSAAGIRDILTNPDVTGRVSKWVIELGPRDIKYKHPKAIKLKSCLTSPLSGSKLSYQESQMCPTFGLCTSTARRKMRAQAQASYYYPHEGISFVMSYRWTSPNPQTTRLNMRLYYTA